MAIQSQQTAANINARRAVRSLQAQASRIVRKPWQDIDEFASELFRLFTSSGLKGSPVGSANLAPAISDRKVVANTAIAPGSTGTQLLSPDTVFRVEKKSTILCFMNVDSSNNGVGPAILNYYLKVDGDSLSNAAAVVNDAASTYYTATRMFAFQVQAGIHAVKWLVDHLGGAGTATVQKDKSHLMMIVFRADDSSTVFKV